jgi:hypothetical protein
VENLGHHEYLEWFCLRSGKIIAMHLTPLLSHLTEFQNKTEYYTLSK